MAGVFATDHLFFDMEGSRRTARRQPDPYILLAAAGAVTQRAKLGTIVANAGLQHPALLLRHFSQLARLFGGERVYAGLGAGWNREEFEALGLVWQAHGQRMQRLEETMVLGRQLFDDGYGHLHGAEIVADDLPLSPDPGVPPRLMLGGGSARALQMAGRYADHVDLNSPTKAGKVSATIGGAVTVVEDNRKRLAATMAGLEESVSILAAAASEAGRPTPTISVMLTHVVSCPAGRDRGERAAPVRTVRAGAGAPRPVPVRFGRAARTDGRLVGGAGRAAQPGLGDPAWQQRRRGLRHIGVLRGEGLTSTGCRGRQLWPSEFRP